MGIISIRRRPSSAQRSPGHLIGYGLLVGGFGSILALWFFLLPLMRALNAENWVEVPCTILESRVGESRGSSSIRSNHKHEFTYRVEVRYEYRFRPGDLENDATAPRYESERYDFLDGVYSNGAAEKRAEVERLAPGTRTTCRVNPDAPDQAVLKAGFPDGLWAAFVTLIFPLVGFSMVVGGIVGMIRDKRRRAGTLPMSAGAANSSLP